MWHSLTLPTRKIKYLSRRGSTGGALQTDWKLNIGMWRSLVAHLAWDEGVARSNRVIPTILRGFWPSFLMSWFSYCSLYVALYTSRKILYQFIINKLLHIFYLYLYVYIFQSFLYHYDLSWTFLPSLFALLQACK